MNLTYYDQNAPVSPSIGERRVSPMKPIAPIRSDCALIFGRNGAV